MNRKTQNVVEEVRKATGGRGVDRIVEVAFDENIQADADMLAVGGAIATYSAGPVPLPPIPFFTLMRNSHTVHFVLVYTMGDHAHDVAIRDVTACLEAGAYRTHVGARFPLAEAAAAHEAQDSGAWSARSWWTSKPEAEWSLYWRRGCRTPPGRGRPAAASARFRGRPDRQRRGGLAGCAGYHHRLRLPVPQDTCNLAKMKALAKALGATILRPYYPAADLYRIVRDDDGLQVDLMVTIHGLRSFAGVRDRATRMEIGGRRCSWPRWTTSSRANVPRSALATSQCWKLWRLLVPRKPPLEKRSSPRSLARLSEPTAN